MIAIPPSARTLLEDRAYGHLVTRNPDGSPQTSMLWFDVEGDELLCNTVDGRVKVRNMRHDPRVIVSVQDRDNPLSYLLVHGRVTAITEDGAEEHIEKLGRRFTGPGERAMKLHLVPVGKAAPPLPRRPEVCTSWMTSWGSIWETALARAE